MTDSVGYHARPELLSLHHDVGPATPPAATAAAAVASLESVPHEPAAPDRADAAHHPAAAVITDGRTVMVPVHTVGAGDSPFVATAPDASGISLPAGRTERAPVRNGRPHILMVAHRSTYPHRRGGVAVVPVARRDA